MWLWLTLSFLYALMKLPQKLIIMYPLHGCNCKRETPIQQDTHSSYRAMVHFWKLDSIKNGIHFQAKNSRFNRVIVIHWETCHFDTYFIAFLTILVHHPNTKMVLALDQCQNALFLSRYARTNLIFRKLSYNILKTQRSPFLGKWMLQPWILLCFLLRKWQNMEEKKVFTAGFEPTTFQL